MQNGLNEYFRQCSRFADDAGRRIAYAVIAPGNAGVYIADL